VGWAAVGIMAGATCYLITDTFWYQLLQGVPLAFADLGIVLITIALLQTQKVAAPWIVLGCLLLGGLL
jgi:chromate transporter